jgi:catechol 2,3-dioxygenase-like lactoylglutathione lyase family enzyme
MAKIKHIALFAKEPRELAQFYIDVFGLKLTGETGLGGVWITDGYMDFAILPYRNERTPLGINHWGFTIEPEEKEAIYKKLEARGHKIFQPGNGDRPYVEDATRDPDGNRFDMTGSMRQIDPEMMRPRTKEELEKTAAVETV